MRIKLTKKLKYDVEETFMYPCGGSVDLSIEQLNSLSLDEADRSVGHEFGYVDEMGSKKGG